ncbi:MAG: C39 family peptidase [bacterium]|nr:C39 family peptidase [bacterium]
MSPKRIMWWIGEHFLDRIDIMRNDIIDIKPFRQTPNYCGPAVVKMRAQLDGILITEEEAIKLTGATKEMGASGSGIKKALEHLGFNVFSKENDTPNNSLDDLRYYIWKKIPVIVDWLSEDGGHYSIVVGIDKKNVILRDPSFWRIRRISIKKFLEFWLDWPGDYAETKNDVILRFMLVATLKEKETKK